MAHAVGFIFLLAICAPWLHRLGREKIGWIVAAPLAAVTGYLCTYLPAIGEGKTFVARYAWAPQLDIDLSFHLDGLALLMALLICGIGTLIALYAGAYLKGHPSLGLFYTYILAFMGSMLGLTLANNVIALFVFWELTTITSYLLIGFEHEGKSARLAALQALLVTAGGGLALMAGLLLLGHIGGSYELTELRTRAEAIRSHAAYLPILGLILLGAFTKSAQFPFHFWLPAAMAAPTPVSAYLHSATMVKAGIYLLARTFPILGGSLAWSASVTPIGLATMVLGAWLAFQASDLKQILAYSTLAVLGTLTMLIGVGIEPAIVAAMAMLLAHAFYKATLFLVAGSVDHEAGTRDIEQLSGLRRTMPVTAIAAGLAALSMAGITPTLGFIAKEGLYEATQQAPYAVFTTSATVGASVLLVAVAGLAAIRPFFGEPSPAAKAAHEAPLSMWLGPVILALLGIVSGVAPVFVAEPLVASSASAIVAATVKAKLVLWHGFNLTLTLSLLTMAAGITIYAFHSRLRLALRPLERVYRYGPAAGYDAALAVLNALALGQTRLLQNGYLRFYLTTIVATMVGLIWLALARVSNAWRAFDLSDIHLYELLLIALVVAATAHVIFTRSRLAAVVSLGVVGYAVALLFVIYGGPDLAMTQFVVETLTVILLVLVLYHLPHFRVQSVRRARLRDAAIALTAGGTITALLLFAISVRTHGAVSDFYAEKSYPEGHGRNIVNVILVDFRAIDTFGEITVLAIAGVGVYALLKLRLHKKKNSQTPHEPTERVPHDESPSVERREAHRSLLEMRDRP